MLFVNPPPVLKANDCKGSHTFGRTESYRYISMNTGGQS